MAARFGLALTAAMLLSVTAHAQSVVTINETFDSYADEAALVAQWAKIGTGVDGVDLINAGSNPFAFPDIQGNAAQYDGASGIGANTAYKWQTPFTLKPDATHNVRFSFDQFVPSTGTANANWKSTVGLRGPGAENLIELGITNSVPANPDFVPYSFRLVSLFPSAENASLGLTAGGYGALPLPVTKNTPQDAEIGGGWHHFVGEISLTTITFSLDLYRDSLQNDDVDTVPGVGVPGVDATIVIDPAGDLNITTAGFNDIRFGMLSASGSSATVTAFDNIKLELVQIAAPPTDDADFDNDGDVDGADFLTWQQGLGAGDNASGDANADNVVDGADLAIWKTKFGPTPPAAPAVGAVPEPATAALAAVAMLAGLAATRRR